MNATRPVVLGALIGIFFCGPATAQQQPQTSPPQKPAAAQNADTAKPPSPAEVQTIVDGWVIVQAQKALDLTDAQFAQFVLRYRTLQETRRRNQRGRMQVIQELGRLTNPNNPPADESVLREKLKALDDLQVQSAADLRKAFDGVDEILNVRQQARLRVFLEQVDRRMLEILTKARAEVAVPAGRRGRGGLR
jgi:hypothetical protein